MGIRVYNNLPKSLKEINDYKVFKKELKIFLLFYSVEEFISTSRYSCYLYGYIHYMLYRYLHIINMYC